MDTQEFGYTQSEYVKAFGLSVDTNAMPMKIKARLLTAPTVQYGGTGKADVVCTTLCSVPSNGF